MKIVTYSRQTKLGKFNRLGILISENEILDVNLTWKAHFEVQGIFNSQKRADETAPHLLSKLLAQYQEASIEILHETLDIYSELTKAGISHTKDHGNLCFSIDEDINLECPIDKINLYRDFYAHEKHVAAGFKKRNEPIPEAWYEIPAYYKGSTSGFIGNNKTIPWPSYTNKLDYELEFGVVIGKDGFNISEENALDHIFGYTIFNDISARDIQKKEMAVRLGPAKGKDFCSIAGPVIITADEFNGEPNLKMQAFINGEKWSEGYSGDSHYTWAQMIAHASREEWLQATDFMGSGTVGTGCGLELDKWIKPGDKIELIVEKIGTLTNIVGEKNV